MRCLPSLLGLCLISLAAVAEPKTLVVPADYPTIKAAIEAAAPGDTILVKPGQYQETLVIDKAVNLKGEAPEQVLLRNSVLAGTIINITAKETVQVENLALEHSDQEPDPNNRKNPALFTVSGGRADIRQCRFRNSAGSGLVVQAGGQASVTDCVAEKNVHSGFVAIGKGSKAEFTQNESRDNGWMGLMIIDDATGSFVGNTAARNTGAGLSVMTMAGDPIIVRDNRSEENQWDGLFVSLAPNITVESNTCLKNKKCGIQFEVNSKATARLNTCSENGFSGILVNGLDASATLENNLAERNAQNGIAVTYGGKAALTGNTATDNTLCGILVSRWDTEVTAAGNTCRKNRKQGILVAAGGRAVLENNLCAENDAFGIAVKDEGTSADLKENRLEGNTQGPESHEPGYPIRMQNQVSKDYPGYALYLGKFEYLETMAARLRQQKNLAANKKWPLETFYEGIQDGCSKMTWKHKAAFMEKMEAWCAQYPNSVTAQIALANTYYNYAWEARGDGWGEEVTKEGKRGFEKNLHEAESILEKAVAFDEKDPELFRSWLDVGIGLSYPREKEEALLHEGLAIDAAYFPLYSMMAFYLTPRWHGDANGDDLQAFFKLTHELSNDALGDRAYALLVANYGTEYHCVYMASGKMADWALVENGFRQWMGDFPESKYYLNRFCYIACWMQQREVASELFGKIGDAPDEAVWGTDLKESNYWKLRRWATMDNTPHPCDGMTDTGWVLPKNFRKILIIGALVLMGASILATVIIVAVFAGKPAKHPRPPAMP